jgi:hypothetical protein
MSADRVKSNHQNVIAPAHSIPIIINGQVLTADEPISKKKKKLMTRHNGRMKQSKDHKIILLSDSHGRGCSERNK